MITQRPQSMSQLSTGIESVMNHDGSFGRENSFLRLVRCHVQRIGARWTARAIVKCRMGVKQDGDVHDADIAQSSVRAGYHRPAVRNPRLNIQDARCAAVPEPGV